MLMGTFYHLLEQAGAMSCLRSIAAALKPDGLLVLELAHAADCFDGSCELWAALTARKHSYHGAGMKGCMTCVSSGGCRPYVRPGKAT